MPPKQKGALKEKELLPRAYKKTDDVKPRDLSEIYHISDEVCGESKYYTTIFILRKIAKIHGQIILILPSSCHRRFLKL